GLALQLRNPPCSCREVVLNRGSHKGAPGAKSNKRTDMTLMATGWARTGALVLAALFLVPASQAQQPAPPPRPQAKPAPGAREQPAGCEAGLQRRVEQLEEQLVDLQVVIGTLESLARGGGTAPPSGGPRGPSTSAAVNAADAGRMDAIETQIRALAAQLEN